MCVTTASSAEPRHAAPHAPCRRRRAERCRAARWRTGAGSSSRILSNTGAASATELLITCSTSAVAVCCSSASFVSLKSRTFSIAITAWSANVWSSASCLSERRPGAVADDRDRADGDGVAHHRHHGHRAISGAAPGCACRRRTARPRRARRRRRRRGRRGSRRRGRSRASAGTESRCASVRRVPVVLGDGDAAHLAVDRAADRHGSALEQSNAAVHDRLEHRLDVGRRFADDAQDLGGGRLAARAPPVSR